MCRYCWGHIATRLIGVADGGSQRRKNAPSGSGRELVGFGRWVRHAFEVTMWLNDVTSSGNDLFGTVCNDFIVVNGKSGLCRSFWD